MLAATLVGAALTITSGAIHIDLWAGSYRYIPTIGPMFLAQGIAAFLLAAAMVAWRRAPILALGALLLLGTIGGYLLSAYVGLFGFRDSLSAPHGTLSLAVEAAGAVILAAAALARFRWALSGRPFVGMRHEPEVRQERGPADPAVGCSG